MTLIVLILTWGYVVFCMVLIFAWKRLENVPHDQTMPDYGVTVIVPVRNEEANIEVLLNSIFDQDYPSNCFEVIVVDDDSVDRTKELASSFIMKGIKNLKVISPDYKQYPNHSPKKAAIQTAIDDASFGLILQTDGDTVVKSGWISSFVKLYTKNKSKLISGPVMYYPGGFVRKMLQMELSSLIGTGAVSLNLGMPTMCNGANLFYERNAFIEAGGYGEYAGYPSGDDEFLLHKFHLFYPGKIAFLKDINGLVMTLPPDSFREFFHQRIRWASKWKAHKGFRNKILAIFIFLVNFSIVALGIATLFTPDLWDLLLVAVGMKLISEYFFLKKVMVDLEQEFNSFCFVITGLIYPIYAVTFGILSNVISPRWKSRKLLNTNDRT